jgi:hypothetical protein
MTHSSIHTAARLALMQIYRDTCRKAHIQKGIGSADISFFSPFLATKYAKQS